MKAKFWVIIVVLFLLAGYALCAVLSRITVIELNHYVALGREFVNPMYWAAVDIKDERIMGVTGIRKLRHITDIGSIIHYRNGDFVDKHKAFHLILKNQQWRVEKAFHVEGNKYGLWIEERPNYDELVIKNILSGQSYLARSRAVEDILSGDESYRRVEDYEKLAYILDSRDENQLLLADAVIKGCPDRGDMKLSDDKEERMRQVASIQDDFIQGLTPEFRKFIQNKDPYHPSITFRIDCDNFLALYSERFNWKMPVNFVVKVKTK